MADAKISELDNLTSADPANDMIPIVDVSATPPASGNTKRISINNLLACSPTATLASATITGDLTVDTNVLKVDSTNNRVGIGTASPASGYALDVRGNIAGGNGTIFGGITYSTRASVGSFSNHDLDLITNGQPVYIVTTAGVHTWINASTTAMTLNSTGLGIGVSPANNLHVKGASGTTSIKIEAITDGVLGLIGSASGLITGSPANNLALRAENGLYLSGGGNSPQFILNSDGNVGIGITPTTAWNTGTNLQVGGMAALYSNNSLGAVDLTSNSIRTGNDSYQYLLAGSNNASRFTQRDGAFRWFSAAAGTSPNAITFGDAKMTLDASGRLFVGKTASALGTVGFETAAGGFIQSTATSDASLFCNRLATDGETIKFYRQTLQVGNISVTTTATAYNTSSDYRLKEAVQPLVGGLARVSALKPSIYKWKVNGSDGEGFIAHELADVVPAAVTGEKDAVNADGSIKSQGIDMSRVVPILVAAIQELTARVQTLETR